MVKNRKSSGMKKRIKKLEEQITPIIKTFEQRQFDYTSAVTAGLPGYALSHASSAAWTMNSLCSTIQDAGSTPFSAGTVRLGDKITLKSLSIKGEVRGSFSASSAAEPDNRVRLMLVRFPEYTPGTTAATLTSQVLQQYPTSTLTPYPSNLSTIYSSYKNTLDQNNSAQLVKYQVLYDRVHALSNPLSAADVVNSRQPWMREFTIKHRFKKGLVVQYGKPLDTQPMLNNIVLIAISDSSVAPHPQINFVSRFKYMDA